MSIIEQKLNLILEQVGKNSEGISRLELMVLKNTKGISDLRSDMERMGKRLEEKIGNMEHRLLNKLAPKSVASNHELRISKLEKHSGA